MSDAPVAQLLALQSVQILYLAAVRAIFVVDTVVVSLFDNVSPLGSPNEVTPTPCPNIS